MKIICIGQNYLEHINELGCSVPENPVFFLKPDTSLLIRNRPFYIPDFSNEIHYETEIIVKICKVGKYIPERYAHNFYDNISIGLDFTARDIQRECIKQGLPWEICKGFDNSAAVGEWISKDVFHNIQDLNFHLTINGKSVQHGNTKDMIFSIDKIISYVSQYVSLRIGDILFTGTPFGVGKVDIGDRLEAFIENNKLLSCSIK